MVYSRLRDLLFPLLGAACLLSSGCLTTIDGACTSIAESHCANCYACAADVDGVSGAELCNIPANKGDSQAACESVLNDRCSDQARSIRDPFDALDKCDNAIGDDTCGELVERHALDQPGAPLTCQKFI
ncbi:hypothetical protein DN745_06165 [Bradymonas sediminis]|uniref:Uncharacterized protein n=2 Tax=Bradymonas sediminis TaxID=1548548 RepID=A0A2Z4FIT0_9DELT|nr:hypothetical protein DN745_06165 [Bradymonas sediminis]